MSGGMSLKIGARKFWKTIFPRAICMGCDGSAERRKEDVHIVARLKFGGER